MSIYLHKSRLVSMDMEKPHRRRRRLRPISPAPTPFIRRLTRTLARLSSLAATLSGLALSVILLAWALLFIVVKPHNTDCLQMNTLVNHGVVEAYKPLMDIEGSYSAQFEHVSAQCSYKITPSTNQCRQFYCAKNTKKSSAAAMTIEFYMVLIGT